MHGNRIVSKKPSFKINFNLDHKVSVLSFRQSTSNILDIAQARSTYTFFG